MIRFLAVLISLGLLAGCAGLDPRDAPGVGKQSPADPGSPSDSAD